MAELEIIKLETDQGPVFEAVMEWNYHWWGQGDGHTYDEVRSTLAHSVNAQRLPQTFVAMLDGEPVGMYQLSMSDDLKGRPDIYPWLINVYVDVRFRGRGISRVLMESVPEKARQAGLKELYLYTSHVGLYEKFGWELVELVPTFKADSPLERLYRMDL